MCHPDIPQWLKPLDLLADTEAQAEGLGDVYKRQGYTLASVIANEFTEATGDLYLSALIEIGLALFLVTIVVNAIARALVWAVTRGAPARSI